MPDQSEKQKAGGSARTAIGSTLRDKLLARGAKPHARMSSLSRYMLEHYDEMLQAVTVDRFRWEDMAAVLDQDEHLLDGDGRPPTADSARLHWSRTTQRVRASEGQDATTPITQRRSPSAAKRGSAAGPAAAPLAAAHLHPVASLGSGPDLAPMPPRQVGAAPGAAPMRSTPVPLSDAEVQRRIDAVERRQGGPKIPLPNQI